MDRLTNHLAATTRAARRDKGLSQEALAEEMGWSVETVSNLERGKTVPALRSLLALSQLLEFDLAAVIAEAAGDRDVAPDRAQLEAEAVRIVRGLDDGKLRLLLGIAEVVKREP